MDKWTRLQVLAIIFLAVSIGYMGLTSHAISAPSIGATVEPGSLSIPCNFVVYPDGSTILAKNGQTGANSRSGTALETVVQNVLDNDLTAGRAFKEKVCIKGSYTFNLRTEGGLRIGFKLSSYTILEIQGRIKLQNSANTAAGAVNFMIRVTDSQQFVEIIGGELDGNKANQVAGQSVYGVEVGNSNDVIVRGMYIHDTSETAIAFEGNLGNCRRFWALYNHVKDGDEDGIGNQYTCQEVFYIGNFVEGFANPGSGIFIEGGVQIIAEGNIVFNNVNGIKVTRGTLTAVQSFTLVGNHAFNNTVNGIQIANAVINGLVTGNFAETNQGHGIVIGAGGGGTAGNITVTGNTVRSNDQASAGNQGIFIQNPANWITIAGNTCFDNQPTPTQDYGIYLQSGVSRVAVVGNTCVGNQLAGIGNFGTNNQVHSSWNNTSWIT